MKEMPEEYFISLGEGEDLFGPFDEKTLERWTRMAARQGLTARQAHLRLLADPSQRRSPQTVPRMRFRTHGRPRAQACAPHQSEGPLPSRAAHSPGVGGPGRRRRGSAWSCS